MMVEAFVRQSFFSSQLLADGAKFKSICYGLRPAGPTWANVSKLAFIKNMKRLLHEIMQWSLFSYIKIPPRLRFLGFRCGKAASAS